MRNMLTGIAILAIFCGTIQLGAAEEKKRNPDSPVRSG